MKKVKCYQNFKLPFTHKTYYFVHHTAFIVTWLLCQYRDITKGATYDWSWRK